MKKETFEWTRTYTYIAILALCAFCFFFVTDDKLLLPTWGTLLGFGFFALVAMDMSWQAWSKSGMIVNTTLGISKGASDGFNPAGDLRMATSKDQPSFACIATGGFVFTGFAVYGSKNFIVCPPEYIQQVGGNLFIRAKLRRIGLKNLPPYVQSSLGQLPKFKEGTIIKKHNLWLGITSSYYGTDTAENLKFEEEFIHKMSVESTVTHMLDEMTERKKSLEPEENNHIRIIQEDND